MTADLWTDTRQRTWEQALDRYEAVVAAQGVASLPAHDHWYHHELPAAIEAREPACVTLDELARITEWKMARGVWRARNLVLVRGNDPDMVIRTTQEAFAMLHAPQGAAANSTDIPWTPITRVAELAGVGPATASAVIAAYAPAHFPFLDELVAAQVPDLGPPAFTMPFYRKYATALRRRAGELGGAWTPARVERALWAHVGGKAGANV
jgi:hypothetical protein